MRMIKLDRGLVQRSILYCLEKGYFSLIRYLIESGHGNIRERDREGRTVLIYCCFIENDTWADHMAMFLLEKGARIVDRDQRGLKRSSLRHCQTKICPSQTIFSFVRFQFT